MLRFYLSCLFTLFYLLGEAGAEQQTVKASWMLKSAPTAKTNGEIDKGSIQVPLLANEGCQRNYKIEKLFWSMDATNEKRIRQAFLGQGSTSDLEITIVKLFAGRAELPTLIIHNDNGKSYRFHFDGFVDYNKWPVKGYQIKANFSADSIVLPKFWNKVEVVCDSPDYPKVGDRKTDNPKAGKTPAEQGKAIHLRILKRHPQIDQFYERPFLYGEATDSPLIVISVPIKDWESISSKERDSLCEYVASLVTQARLSPFSYTEIPQTAPFAPKLRENVSKMTDRSWGILVGQISEDGRDINSDKLLKTGK